MKFENVERKKIGTVGVDSGQLLLIDPSYVRGMVQRQPNLIGIKFWGEAKKRVTEGLAKENITIHQWGGHTYVPVNNVEEHDAMNKRIRKLAAEQTIVTATLTDGYYSELSAGTLSKEQVGTVENGLGVAFSSGLGDGSYDVYATFADVPNWGRRITKVEVEFVNEFEADQMSKLF